jgi:hypothetical protein
MRTLGGFCIVLLCVGSLFAQRNGGAGVQGRAAHGPSAIRWPYSGYSYSGYTGYNSFRGSYFYPVFVGGLYDYGPYEYTDQSAAPQQQQPNNVTVVYPPQQAPVTASPVIVNVGIPPGQGQAAPPGSQTPPQSSYQEPAQQPDDTASAESTHYLIALKDHTIYSAVAYWVDGSTLHYFTTGSTHNQISLSLVDRPLTERLNQGTGLEVKLPPAK